MCTTHLVMNVNEPKLPAQHLCGRTTDEAMFVYKQFSNSVRSMKVHQNVLCRIESSTLTHIVFSYDTFWQHQIRVHCEVVQTTLFTAQYVIGRIFWQFRMPGIMKTRGQRKKSPEKENTVKSKKRVAKPKENQNAKSKRQKEVTVLDETNSPLSDDTSVKSFNETRQNSQGTFLHK